AVDQVGALAGDDVLHRAVDVVALLGDVVLVGVGAVVGLPVDRDHDPLGAIRVVDGVGAGAADQRVGAVASEQVVVAPAPVEAVDGVRLVVTRERVAVHRALEILDVRVDRVAGAGGAVVGGAVEIGRHAGATDAAPVAVAHLVGALAADEVVPPVVVCIEVVV